MNNPCGFLVCGEALIDLVPIDTGPEPMMRAVCGGSPYNVAIGLGRLGADTRFLGRLSLDGNGRRLASRLAQNGVSLDLITYAAAPSTLAYVFPQEPGRPDVSYAFYVEGTSGAVFQEQDFPIALPASVGLVHFGSFAALLGRSGALVRAFAKSSGRIVSYDPNIRPTITPDPVTTRPIVAACIGAADIVKLSDADAEWLYPGRPLDDVMSDILGMGPSMVAITRGSEGAIAGTRTVRVALPGTPTQVVDTVGAGDTFMAAFLWDLGRRGLIDRDALAGASQTQLGGATSLACGAAALVCGRHGAEPPFRAELESAGGNEGQG